MVSFDDEIESDLQALEARGLRRRTRVLESAQGCEVVVDGRQLINFASNDYLGLANDPRVIEAARADGLGLGVGSSRLIVGNHQAHRLLETRIGEWLARDGVTLFNSGYAANTGVLRALLKPSDVVFSDALNHASIIDGCRLAGCRVSIFEHGNLRQLEKQLSESARGSRRLVVSESLFSMDGDVADVGALAAICRRFDAVLVLDEAHAIGSWGSGRGVAFDAGVKPDVTIGTFGKALGTFGAFAASSKPVAEWLWNRARTLVFSTGLPPMLAAATAASIAIVASSDGAARRQRLRERASRIHAKIGSVGESMIVPVLLGDEQAVLRAGTFLEEKGVLVGVIRPPTVPMGTCRLRISVTSEHTDEQADRLVEALFHMKQSMPK